MARKRISGAPVVDELGHCIGILSAFDFVLRRHKEHVHAGDLLSGAGIPIVGALNLTKGTLGNKQMEAVIGDVVTQIGAGKTIADPLERSGVFPSMLVQLVNMGERSGKLSELLDQASDAFEERTQQSVKTFTAILPPVLVVILAGVVGFVVLAILMALLAAQDAAMAG